jgi:hypothetical protein
LEKDPDSRPDAKQLIEWDEIQVYVKQVVSLVLNSDWETGYLMKI